ENERLKFRLEDIRQAGESYDLLLMMDVLEHVEHYRGFLREIRHKAQYKVFQVSLNLSAQTLLRGLSRMRTVFGMRILFTKEVFLRALEDADYDIVDWFYTLPSVDLPSRELPRKLMKIPRKLIFTLSPDWTSRVLGGCRLLVLAK